MILKCIFMKWDEGMDWIDLAEDKDKWGVVAKPVMNFRVPKNAGNLLTWRGSISCSRKTLLH
jgi:hypothetical protein